MVGCIVQKCQGKRFKVIQNLRSIDVYPRASHLFVASIRWRGSLHLSHTFQWFSKAAPLYLTSVIFKAISNLSNLHSMPQGLQCRGRSKLLVGRAVTIKGGRSVKTSPVLPGWAKVLLKRLFWGTLNVVKWSPPQLGHSKRPSLTTRAKQTPSPLPKPCQFPSNPLGLDPVRRYSSAGGLHDCRGQIRI